jgi:hypothetical protein
VRGLLRSFVSFVGLVILCVGLSATSVSAATVAWEIAAPAQTTTFTAAEAASYVYRLYVNSTSSGAPLINVTCAITNLKLVKTCQCVLPSTVKPGDVIFLTTAYADGSGESGPSNTATFVIPNSPSNVRFLKALWRVVRTPERAIAAMRRW